MTLKEWKEALRRLAILAETLPVHQSEALKTLLKATDQAQRVSMENVRLTAEANDDWRVLDILSQLREGK
jgi:hypothetical protein